MREYWIVQVNYGVIDVWHSFSKFVQDGKEYTNKDYHPHRFKSERECEECINKLKTIDPSPEVKYRSCHYVINKSYKSY